MVYSRVLIQRREAMTHFYRIRIEGRLSAQWQDWFDGMSVTLEADGTTLLSGPVPDQHALYGLLRKVRDLGLPLISVHQIPDTLNRQSSNEKRSTKQINTNKNAAKKIDTKVLLSTLWIVVMINMLKADILSLYIPGALDELVEFAGETPIPLLMLGGAIMMEISIVMIILSRVLKYGLNRWLNIIAGIITIVFVVGPGASYPHYIFIATVEVICLLLIIWNAWKWSSSEE